MDVMVVNTVPRFGQYSPEFERKVFGLVQNALFSREQLIRKALDPRRDLGEECGHPAVLTADKYQDLYDRNGIASRIVEVFPKETWQVEPEVYEDESIDTETPFEMDWKQLGLRLRTQGMRDPDTDEELQSYYQDDCSSPVWEYLKRIDVVSGIGRFGVLLFGFDDGLPLDKPVRRRAGQKLYYMRTFPEVMADIDAIDEDQVSPRYGQPTYYNLTITNPLTEEFEGSAASSLSALGPVGETHRVHHSRVLHVSSDKILSSELFGIPRLQQPVNRALDVDKLYGSSAEMYYKGAFFGLSFETHPQLGEDPDIDYDRVKDSVERYMNGLQRYLNLTGITAKSLSPQVVDPTPQVRIQLEAVCIELGIPLRVFMGSERGELASSQDDAAWNDRLRERQRYHVNPRIIVPFVDRMIHAGCLRRPKKSYKIAWPDLQSQTGQEKSQIAFQRTQALVQYIKGQGWRVIPPLDFLSRVLGFDEAEAKQILANAKAEGLFDLEKAVQPAKLLGEEDGVKGAEEDPKSSRVKKDQGDYTGQGGGQDGGKKKTNGRATPQEKIGG